MLQPPGGPAGLPEQPDNNSATDYGQTARSFREQRYLPVRGILPPTILDFLNVYYAVQLANNRFSSDTQCPSSLALGGDPALDAVLEWIRPAVARFTGLELTSTYSYTRVYAAGEVLKRHKDRAACEISMTVSIRIPADQGPSVIYLKPPDAEPAKVEMLEGDGCIYAGTEVEHWREPFACDGYIQLFLHFIETNGVNFPEHKYDGRKALGTSIDAQSLR